MYTKIVKYLKGAERFIRSSNLLNGRDVQTLKASAGTSRTECDCLWRDCGDCKL